jgi:hypothetical protein
MKKCRHTLIKHCIYANGGGAVTKQTGKDYRAKNRARLKKFYTRQAASGKKRISALLSGDAYSLLLREKEKTGATISDIVQTALSAAYSRKPEPENKAQAQENPRGTGRIILSQMDLFRQDHIDRIPDFTGWPLGIHERDKILVMVAETMPGKQNSRARVTLLNQKGVPVNTKSGQYGGKWDCKKFSDNLRLARQRLEKNSKSE